MTITITDEFREKVDKAARSVAGRNTMVDWEDVSQDMWVWMLENPAQYDKYTKMEDPFNNLKRIAKQEIYKQNNAYEHFTGDYTYTPTEVRGLASEYLLDSNLEAVSEHVDLVEGLLMVKEDAPAYFKTLTDKYVHGYTVATNMLSKSVDKLTNCMNQVNKAARYSYTGPGTRKVMTNAASQAKSWNQMEQNAGNSGTNRDW